jgi:hypothetical protein
MPKKHRLLKLELLEELLRFPQDVATLGELEFVIWRKPHEGRLAPYGCVFLNGLPKPEQVSVMRPETSRLEDARMLADGIRSFTLFDNRIFSGLAVFNDTGADELRLVDFLRNNPVEMIITGDASGLVKVYTKEFIYLQQHRVWSAKPMVGTILRDILARVPMAQPKILEEILAFAYHGLSARRIGATLVWFFADPTAEEIQNIKPPHDLSYLKLSPEVDAHAKILRHFLSQVDGATLLAPERPRPG